jgi:hypothetical protein
MYPFSWSRLGQSEATDGLFIEKDLDESSNNATTRLFHYASYYFHPNSPRHYSIYYTLGYLLYMYRAVLYSVHIEKSVIK